MKRKVVLAALCLGLVVASAAPASADVVHIGRASARGDYAIAVASGDVDNPTRLWVKVKARPNQRIDANWTVVCSRGTGAGSKDGDFSGVTPIKRAIKMPYTNPDYCSVAASAQLSDSGKIVVILLARVA